MIKYVFFFCISSVICHNHIGSSLSLLELKLCLITLFGLVLFDSVPLTVKENSKQSKSEKQRESALLQGEAVESKQKKWELKYEEKYADW